MSKVLVLGKVLHTHHYNRLYYKACRKCYSKIHSIQNDGYIQLMCSKCGIVKSPEETIARYRLSCRITDSYVTADVTVFGTQLEQFIGCSAQYLSTYVQWMLDNGLKEELLQQAIDEVFNDNCFLFGFKLNGPLPNKEKAVTLQDVLNASNLQSTFNHTQTQTTNQFNTTHSPQDAGVIAWQMIHASAKHKGHNTVISVLKHKVYTRMQLDCTLKKTAVVNNKHFVQDISFQSFSACPVTIQVKIVSTAHHDSTVSGQSGIELTSDTIRESHISSSNSTCCENEQSQALRSDVHLNITRNAAGMTVTTATNGSLSEENVKKGTESRELLRRYSTVLDSTIVSVIRPESQSADETLCSNINRTHSLMLTPKDTDFTPSTVYSHDPGLKLDYTQNLNNSCMFNLRDISENCDETIDVGNPDIAPLISTTGAEQNDSNLSEKQSCLMNNSEASDLDESLLLLQCNTEHLTFANETVSQIEMCRNGVEVDALTCPYSEDIAAFLEDSSMQIPTQETADASIPQECCLNVRSVLKRTSQSQVREFSGSLSLNLLQPFSQMKENSLHNDMSSSISQEGKIPKSSFDTINNKASKVNTISLHESMQHTGDTQEDVDLVDVPYSEDLAAFLDDSSMVDNLNSQNNNDCFWEVSNIRTTGNTRHIFSNELLDNLPLKNDQGTPSTDCIDQRIKSVETDRLVSATTDQNAKVVVERQLLPFVTPDKPPIEKSRSELKVKYSRANKELTNSWTHLDEVPFSEDHDRFLLDTESQDTFCVADSEESADRKILAIVQSSSHSNCSQNVQLGSTNKKSSNETVLFRSTKLPCKNNEQLPDVFSSEPSLDGPLVNTKQVPAIIPVQKCTSSAAQTENSKMHVSSKYLPEPDSNFKELFSEPVEDSEPLFSEPQPFSEDLFSEAVISSEDVNNISVKMKDVQITSRIPISVVGEKRTDSSKHKVHLLRSPVNEVIDDILYSEELFSESFTASGSQHKTHQLGYAAQKTDSQSSLGTGNQESGPSNNTGDGLSTTLSYAPSPVVLPRHIHQTSNLSNGSEDLFSDSSDLFGDSSGDSFEFSYDKPNLIEHFPQERTAYSEPQCNLKEDGLLTSSKKQMTRLSPCKMKSAKGVRFAKRLEQEEFIANLDHVMKNTPAVMPLKIRKRSILRPVNRLYNTPVSNRYHDIEDNPVSSGKRGKENCLRSSDLNICHSLVAQKYPLQSTPAHRDIQQKKKLAVLESTPVLFESDGSLFSSPSLSVQSSRVSSLSSSLKPSLSTPSSSCRLFCSLNYSKAKRKANVPTSFKHCDIESEGSLFGDSSCRGDTSTEHSKLFSFRLSLAKQDNGLQNGSNDSSSSLDGSDFVPSSQPYR